MGSRWLSSPLAVGGAAAHSAAEEDFQDLVKRLQGEKPKFARRQQDLLSERYDLVDRPAAGVAMSRGKPVQEGVRAKLPAGVTWDRLGRMSPDEIKSKDLWPAGFFPCRILITRPAE